MSPELDTLECLAAETMTLRNAWRQYSSSPGASPDGFRRFIDVWSSDGSIRTTLNDNPVPRWRLLEILENLDSPEAGTIVLSLTAQGFLRFQG
jgi:hypothetical protein